MSTDILFSGLPDPRGLKARRHKLGSILSLIILSLLNGRKGLMAAFRLGRSLTREQKAALGFAPGRKTPCHATLTELVRRLDPHALSARMGELVLQSSGIGPNGLLHIQLDGKTLRGSVDEEGRAMHCLSAFCAELGGVVDGQASRGKGREIPDALLLLERLDLRGKVVTGDAMFCQKAIADKIVEKGGDYMLQVKDNQKLLKEDIETAFKEPVFPLGDLRNGSGKNTRADREARH